MKAKLRGSYNVTRMQSIAPRYFGVRRPAVAFLQRYLLDSVL